MVKLFVSKFLTHHLTDRAFGGRRRQNRERFRPQLDCLEGRLVPSTVRWINPAGGDWTC
jgi:hypothetical protein